MKSWGPCTWRCRYCLVSCLSSRCPEDRGTVGEEDLQFKPVRHDNAENVECKLKGNKLSARGVSSRLGSPNWCNGVKDTGSDAVQDSGCASWLSVKLLKSSRNPSPNAPKYTHRKTSSLHSAPLIVEPLQRHTTGRQGQWL